MDGDERGRARPRRRQAQLHDPVFGNLRHDRQHQRGRSRRHRAHERRLVVHRDELWSRDDADVALRGERDLERNRIDRASRGGRLSGQAEPRANRRASRSPARLVSVTSSSRA